MGRPTGAHVCGPLEPFVRGFLLWLIELGYSWTAQRVRLRLMAELSRWMAARGMGAADLSQPLFDTFIDGCPSLGRRWCSPTAQRQLLAYLRGIGAVPTPEAPVSTGAVDRLIDQFSEYLVRERGLTAGSGTIRDYRRVAAVFLSGRLDMSGEGFDRTTAEEVSSFVLAECRRLRPRSAKLIVTVLRALLRYVYLEGLTASDLSGAVPLVAGWRGASLPRAVEADWVRGLLVSCDRHCATGRRDFAILLLLVRLGLRSGEVAAIQLGDVDWRSGEIVVRGKGDRHERLPLPSDVGDGLVDYLRHGRPDRHDPHLFLKTRAPFGPLSGGTVRMVVHYACDRAEIARVGAHRLRHTVATEALRAGAPLEEIASLLRHRRHATTVLYAKVDWERLRELARPWPGSTR